MKPTKTDKLQLVPVEVTAREGPGALYEKRKALLARCRCGSRLWTVFQIDGQTHIHLQCASCDETYCHGGECHEELTRERE